MMLEFYKMTAAESDFVVVDNRDLALSSVLSKENIADVCNRRFGVGAEGLIVVEPAQGKAAARMRCYSADGTEGGMNTSAALCFAAFVDFLLDDGRRKLRFETKDGLVKATVNEDDSVTLLPPAGEPVAGHAYIVFRGEVIICEE
mgnify:CR=1 FL=1